jgi:hypothetical protein
MKISAILLISVFVFIGCGEKPKKKKIDDGGNEWIVQEVEDEGHTYRVFYRRSGYGGYCWSKHSLKCTACK